MYKCFVFLFLFFCWFLYFPSFGLTFWGLWSRTKATSLKLATIGQHPIKFKGLYYPFKKLKWNGRELGGGLENRPCTEPLPISNMVWLTKSSLKEVVLWQTTTKGRPSEGQSNFWCWKAQARQMHATRIEYLDVFLWF